MLSREPGRFFVPTKRAPNAVHFVGHHRFAIAGSTEYNTPLALPARDCFRGGTDEKRIIHWCFTERAEVFCFVTERAEQLLHFFFVSETGVIGAEGNFHQTRITRIRTKW